MPAVNIYLDMHHAFFITVRKRHIIMGTRRQYMSIFKKRKLSSSQVIMYGFTALILCGALLLTLPISSIDGSSCSFLDALFTSTSAVCVTGLIVRDTATSWTLFGKFILLLLIQIGGLGIVTAGATLSIIAGRRIGLSQRSNIADSISVTHLGGIVNMTKMIIKGTMIVELCGALLLSFVFIPEFGFIKGIGYSIFHSVSAFCNAGFDLMGVKEQFSSLTYFSANYLFNITIMLLIVIGGISFMTWDDIIKHKKHIHRYSMQSKLILTVTSVLIFVPALLFFIFEYGDLPFKERLIASLFQSVTTRTAGFNTTDLNAFSDGGKVLMCFLMLIGGSPGSTAGGLKTTTIAVIVLGTITVIRNRTELSAFGRAIDETVLLRANAIFVMYVTIAVSSAILISRIEGVSLISALFETCSAIGTVGLTLGLTPSLHVASRLILIMMMFAGRIGTLTLIYAVFRTQRKPAAARLIKDNIVVG